MDGTGNSLYNGCEGYLLKSEHQLPYLILLKLIKQLCDRKKDPCVHHAIYSSIQNTKIFMYKHFKYWNNSEDNISVNNFFTTLNSISDSSIIVNYISTELTSMTLQNIYEFFQSLEDCFFPESMRPDDYVSETTNHVLKCIISFKLCSIIQIYDLIIEIGTKIKRIDIISLENHLEIPKTIINKHNMALFDQLNDENDCFNTIETIRRDNNYSINNHLNFNDFNVHNCMLHLLMSFVYIKKQSYQMALEHVSLSINVSMLVVDNIMCNILINLSRACFLWTLTFLYEHIDNNIDNFFLTIDKLHSPMNFPILNEVKIFFQIFKFFYCSPMIGSTNNIKSINKLSILSKDFLFSCLYFKSLLWFVHGFKSISIITLQSIVKSYSNENDSLFKMDEYNYVCVVLKMMEANEPTITTINSNHLDFLNFFDLSNYFKYEESLISLLAMKKSVALELIICDFKITRGDHLVAKEMLLKLDKYLCEKSISKQNKLTLRLLVQYIKCCILLSKCYMLSDEPFKSLTFCNLAMKYCFDYDMKTFYKYTYNVMWDIIAKYSKKLIQECFYFNQKISNLSEINHKKCRVFF